MVAIRLSGKCPDCNDKLVRRERRSDGAPFLGCNSYPACGFTEPLDSWLAGIANEVAKLQTELAQLKKAPAVPKKVVAANADVEALRTRLDAVEGLVAELQDNLNLLFQ